MTDHQQDQAGSLSWLRTSGNILEHPDPLYVIGETALGLLLISGAAYPLWGWTLLHSFLLAVAWGSLTVAGMISIGKWLSGITENKIAWLLLAALCAVVVWISQVMSSQKVADIVADDPAGMTNSVILFSVLYSIAITCVCGAAISLPIILRYLILVQFTESPFQLGSSEKIRRLVAAVAVFSTMVATICILDTKIFSSRNAVAEVIVFLDYHPRFSVDHLPQGALVAYLGDHISYTVSDPDQGWQFASMVPVLKVPNHR